MLSEDRYDISASIKQFLEHNAVLCSYFSPSLPFTPCSRNQFPSPAFCWHNTTTPVRKSICIVDQSPLLPKCSPTYKQTHTHTDSTLNKNTWTRPWHATPTLLSRMGALAIKNTQIQCVCAYRRTIIYTFGRCFNLKCLKNIFMKVYFYEFVCESNPWGLAPCFTRRAAGTQSLYFIRKNKS